MVEPVFYARPESEPVRLRLPPRLTSWDAAAHPDQQRLRESVGDAGRLLEPVLAGRSEPLSLRLDVGLPDRIPLLEQHDLDNYAHPLASHLHRLGVTFTSVWCTKRHAEHSTVRVAGAVPVETPVAGYQGSVRTTASAETVRYKQEIREQLPDGPALPDGPVRLRLAYVVGPRRNWLNLWKPTIDALGNMLGHTTPYRDWHPRDGRITELGLSHTFERALGNDVLIAIAADALAPPSATAGVSAVRDR